VQANKTVEVFCSYALEDENWFHELKAHLSLSRRQGLFTLWHSQLIAPGTDRQQVIDTYIETADVILLLISADFFASDSCGIEMNHTLERYQRGGVQVIPILIRQVHWKNAPFAHLRVLPMNAKPLALWNDKDAGLTDVAANLCSVIEGKPLTEPDIPFEPVCPYKGLSPYNEEDAEFFFGREVYLQELLDLLRNERRFLLLLGPKSSGKTSLVQAGLIPLLRRHGLPGATFKYFVRYVPQKPLLKTWLALSVFYKASTSLEGLFRWRSEHPLPERLVFIVDALEELFHYADEAERKQFVEQLVEIIRDDLATIILVMRDDYYSDLAAYETLIHYMETRISNVPCLTSGMAHAIILKPAQVVGLKIEESLVNTMAYDTMSTQAEPRRRRLHRHSSVLPLLSYTLTRMFQQREDFELKAQTYHDLGGISGSLAGWASQTYSKLSPKQKGLARRIFTDLVFLGDESSDVLDKKQGRFLNTLARNEQERSVVEEVVKQFSSDHLLITRRDEVQHDVYVDMIHEALIYEWSLLQDWLREDRQFLLWRHVFLEQAERWDQLRTQVSEESAGEVLLRERELLVAQGWYQEHGTEWTENERLFLFASKHSIEQNKQQQQAYEQAQKDKESLFAQTLAMQALLLQEQQPQQIELSILLAAESMKRHPSFEADKALKKGLQLLPQSIQHIQRTTGYTRLAISGDGSRLLAVGEAGLIWIQYAYDETYDEILQEFTSVYAMALNFDGTVALLVYSDMQARDAWVVDLFREQPPRRLSHNEAVINVMWRDDEAITVTESGKILCWDIADATLQRRFAHPGLTTVSMSSDECYLATGSRDGTVKLWDFVRGVCIDTISYKQTVHVVAFHPEQPLLATATDDTIFVWNWETEKRRSFFQQSRTVKAHFGVTSPIVALGFWENILVAGDRKNLRLCNIDTNQVLFSHDFRTPLQTLLVHPGEHIVATAETDGTVFLWDLTRTKSVPVAVLPHPGAVQDLCFHPYKPYVATVSQNGGVRLWQYGVSRQLTMLEYPGTIEDMGFYQQEGVLYLQIGLKESEASRRQVWTVAPGDVLLSPSVQERAITSRRLSQSMFPASAFEEWLSSSGIYKVIRASSTDIRLFERRREGFVQYASYTHPSALLAVAISSDGHYLALADETYTLSIWNWDQHHLDVLPWKRPQEVSHLIFCGERSLLVVSGKNKSTIEIWDWPEREFRYLRHHGSQINGLEIHPDGHSFLTVSDDALVRAWSCEKEEQLYMLRHSTQAQQALYSPTGKYILTISADSVVHIWETATGHPLAELEHNGEVYRLALSADETYLATASRDEYIRIWHWTSDALFEEARYHMTRNLTPEEWLQYLGDTPYEETFILDWRADERTHLP
jgi:WD40 repeat protein